MYIGKILVSGLGPVGGFFVTYLTHKWGPDAVDITVYDPMLGKFSRKQILTIQPEIMKLIDNEFPKDLTKQFHKTGCYVKNPAFDTNGKCYKKPTSEGFFTMRTNNIEQLFYNHIRKLPNVTLIATKLPTNLDLKKFDFIISASGGRDHLNELIGNKYRREYLSNALIVTFDPKNRKVFDEETNGIPTLRRSVDSKQLRYRGYKSKSGNYYLGVQLGKNEINELQNFVDQNGDITCSNMPPMLDKILKNAYNKYEINGIKCQTLSVTFFPIVRQIATVPTDFIKGRVEAGKGKTEKNPLVFLVGDTLATPHFFSGVGVNSGFRAVHFLGNLLGAGGGGMSRNEIKRIYMKEAKAIQAFLATISHQVTLDMDQVNMMCEKYTKEEIYEIAKKHYLYPEGMSKKEVCLSVGRLLLKH